MENEALNAAAGISNTPAVRDTDAQDNPPARIKKIGKMTYIVWVHFSTTSKESFEDNQIPRWQSERASAVETVYFQAGVYPVPGTREASADTPYVIGLRAAG